MKLTASVFRTLLLATRFQRGRGGSQNVGFSYGRKENLACDEQHNGNTSNDSLFSEYYKMKHLEDLVKAFTIEKHVAGIRCSSRVNEPTFFTY